MRVRVAAGAVSEDLPFESLYRHGFARVAACTIPVAIADPARNADAVLAAAREAHQAGAAPCRRPRLVSIAEG
jgi:NAD+ synthase (glutamine-hydrolysing)